MAKKNLKKGIFITFEGVEGCGKSTHSWKIYTFLKKSGYDTIYVREPGGTKIGEKIRRILLDRTNKEMSERTELFLFEANRAQIIKEVIRPALEQRRIVISDRFSDSTTAYQGYAGKMDRKFIEGMNEFASYDIKPDLTIILDIQPEIGLKRAVQGRKKDRMESKTLLYHNRVRQGYRNMARKYRLRIKLIKVKDDIDETQRLVQKEALKVIS